MSLRKKLREGRPYWVTSVVVLAAICQSGCEAADSGKVATANRMPGGRGAATVEVKRKPNVIIIMTDDQGSVDVNCYGASDLITPNMDAIAARGVRFTQFLSASPICAPSRAALLTGRIPQRAGFPGPSSASWRGGHGMPTEQVTIAEMFKSAGYTTGHFGKWHLGYVPPEYPMAQGFDESLGFMGGCVDNYSHYFYWFGPNKHDLWHNGEEVWLDGQYLPELMTKRCTSFMEANREKPFLIYLAFNTPHYPLQGTNKWREKYKALPEARREYAASVSTTDELIGQVLSKLDELGIRNDTIVVFQSDQGHSTEGAAYGGGGNAGPYRGSKFSLFEGGIRVPAMISWPGHLPEGAVRGQVVSSCDWVPTLGELCGVTVGSSAPGGELDGRSMMPVIRSESAATAHPVFYWQTENKEWAVREGPWKLIGNPVDATMKGAVIAANAPGTAVANAPVSKGATKPDLLFLSNLDRDIGERTNVVEANPEVVQRLIAMRKAFVERVKDEKDGPSGK